MTSGSEVLVRNGAFLTLSSFLRWVMPCARAEKESPVCALYSSSELAKAAMNCVSSAKGNIPTIEIPDLTIVRQE
jgi:hypothetical protein